MFRRLSDERGDLVVTPTILICGVALTFVLAGVAYMGSRAVGARVENSRQGVTLDDEGNVQGGIGVIPVPTPTAEPEATSTPRVVTRERVVTQEPAPAPEPTQDSGVVILNPGNDGHVTEGESSTSNSGEETEEPHDEPTEDPHQGNCCGE